MTFLGYIRVSTTRQSKQFSLQAQKEAIESFCEQRGYKLIGITEESRSAVKDRPVFEKTLRRVLDEEELDGLIIAKLDRMGRSVKDLAGLAAQLQEAGKQLISVQDNLDTSTANGRLLFNMLATIAEYERELMLERTREGRKRAMQQGKLTHRPRKEIDRFELKSLYQRGVPIAQLARLFDVHKDTIRRRLDEMGLRTGPRNSRAGTEEGAPYGP